MDITAHSMILTALGVDLMQDNLAFSEPPRMGLSKEITTTFMKVTPPVAHALKERVKDEEEMVFEISEENRVAMLMIDRRLTYSEFLQKQTLRYPEQFKKSEVHLTIKSEENGTSMTIVKRPNK